MSLQLPGYDLLELLREGNHLEVYDAWSHERGTRVIVKALRRGLPDAEEAEQRLLEEGRLLRDLTHPHIVRGYEVHEEPWPFIVIETLDGETLGHMVEVSETELSVEEVAHLGLHLASAIRYLHRHGYLHLDLKPSNIIAEAGKARLLDLSVARPPGPAHGGIGTDLYMAPEQARGGDLTAAADVWGLGVVLFEAATLEPAFDTDDPDDFPQLHERAPLVSDVVPEMAPLDALVAACLEPAAAARPTVEEVIAQLEVLAGLPSQAG
jgi:serine/threonine protein kinase